jgi:regulator of replication initiation timing
MDIASAYMAAKFIQDSLKAILDKKVESAAKEKIREILEKVGPIQDTLFELREELFRLQTENTQLKEELKENEDWKRKLTEYQLTETPGGAVVYQFKGEPKHYICPSCLNKKEVHILQDTRTMGGGFSCPGCSKLFRIKQTRYPDDPAPSWG